MFDKVLPLFGGNKWIRFTPDMIHVKGVNITFIGVLTLCEFATSATVEISAMNLMLLPIDWSQEMRLYIQWRPQKCVCHQHILLIPTMY